MTVIEQAMAEARALGYQEAMEHVKINVKYEIDPLDGLQERLDKLKEKTNER